MNKIPTRLNKEPLIEAIWQAQFEPKDGLPVGDLLPGILYSALKVDYPNLQLHRLPAADIPAPVAQIDPNLRFTAKYRMEEPGGPFLFQVGDRVVTMNCRKPYSGWSAFKERILKLIDVIESSGLVPTPMRHSLRYIDFLTLEPPPNLSSLQLSVKLGEFDIQVRPLQIRVELLDGACIHVVQVATPAQVAFPEGMKEGSIVDIETLSTENLKSWDTIATQIDHMHDRSKALFFENILTKQAVDQLEPEHRE